jgi:hypothetical protein
MRATRRMVLGGFAAGLALAPTLPGHFATLALRRRAVVSLHMDQPYIDFGGEALAFMPPPGARGAAHAATLSDEQLRRVLAYI